MSGSALRIALAQVDLLVGDAEGNADRVLAVAERAAGADLILFPELTLAGYPPEDLLFQVMLDWACKAKLEVPPRQ